MAVAVYAGSFDPFTYGHLDILRQGLEMFECIHNRHNVFTSFLYIVGVGVFDFIVEEANGIENY